MGLDMYLTKKTYIGEEYAHRKITGIIDIKENEKPLNIQFNRVSEISERVGYWRKANQIHKWFVDNVQDGEDDCKEYEVSEEQLKQLLADCKAVLANKDKAPELMATERGFFFGGIDYDEYYFQEIEETIVIVEAALSERTEDGKYLQGDYCYRASW